MCVCACTEGQKGVETALVTENTITVQFHALLTMVHPNRKAILQTDVTTQKH